MTPIQEVLSTRIKSLEQELERVLEERRGHGKTHFEPEVLAEHRSFKLGLPSYLLQSRILAYVTAPIIYAGIVPFCLLDLFLTVYQGICFPVYGVPKVKRADYLIFDRARLKYLNILERFNCWYCSYGNGVLAYGVEVAARTEQHWCPIKHAQRMRAPHSRYSHFFDYGDAKQYSEKIETVRNDFVDVRTLTSKEPDSSLK
jgi:hypothetical protein